MGKKKEEKNTFKKILDLVLNLIFLTLNHKFYKNNKVYKLQFKIHDTIFINFDIYKH